MSAKLTQRSLNCVEFVCSLELQEEHRALFFSSLCCGGAAGNVKVISNCESFFRWRSSSRLAPGVRNLIIAHEPGTVRLRGLSLPKPSPLLSSSLVFFFSPQSVDLLLLLCLFSQRRRSTTWRVSWRSMASRCPPSARSAGSWPMSSLWTKLHVRGGSDVGGWGDLIAADYIWDDSCFHNETDANVLNPPVIQTLFWICQLFT